MNQFQPLAADDPRRLGAYDIVARLGEGGQGIVYLGRGASGEQVAVKLLHNALVADPDARTRFLREVAVAQRVARFSTAPVLHADLDGSRPYIVSEYVPGPSLRQLVDGEGPRRGAALERLAISTATALAAIHRAGILHRDLKPANVLMGPEGPVVIDFGIARALDAPGATATGMAMGTPSYLAPEQLSGAQVTEAADVFAWGVTMVFAATGKPAFGSDSIPVVMNRILHQEPEMEGLEGTLGELVAACLSKDPADRPTADEIIVKLTGQPVPKAAIEPVPSPLTAVPPVSGVSGPSPASGPLSGQPNPLAGLAQPAHSPKPTGASPLAGLARPAPGTGPQPSGPQPASPYALSSEVHGASGPYAPPSGPYAPPSGPNAAPGSPGGHGSASGPGASGPMGGSAPMGASGPSGPMGASVPMGAYGGGAPAPGSENAAPTPPPIPGRSSLTRAATARPAAGSPKPRRTLVLALSGAAATVLVVGGVVGVTQLTGAPSKLVSALGSSPSASAVSTDGAAGGQPGEPLTEEPTEAVTPTQEGSPSWEPLPTPTKTKHKPVVKLPEPTVVPTTQPTTKPTKNTPKPTPKPTKTKGKDMVDPANPVISGDPATTAKPTQTPTPTAKPTVKPTPKPTPKPNTYSAVRVCGTGYKVINSHALGSKATIYLLYNATAGKNCVVTMSKLVYPNKVKMNAILQVKGGSSAANPGSFTAYAGPVRLASAKKCVIWGGTWNTLTWKSGWSHCT